MNTPNPTFLERICRDLGWLQPGQPLHEANIPPELLSRYPGAAALLRTTTGETTPGTEHQAPNTPTATAVVSTPEPAPTGIPEPETTASAEKKRSRKHCRGLTNSGNLCYAYKMGTGDLCVFHNAKAVNESQWDKALEQFDPEVVEEARSAALDLDLLPVTIVDNNTFLSMAEGLFRLAASGAVPERMLAHLRHILRMVQRALPGREEHRAAPEESEHRERVEQVLKAATKIRDRLDKHDLRRRDLDTEDAGRKRAAILQANQRYGPSPASKIPKLRSMLSY